MHRRSAALLPLLVTAGLLAAPGVVAESSPEPREVAAAAAATPPATVPEVVQHRPVSLRIPSLGVTSAVMDLGLTATGALQVPPAGFPAGWYTGSPAPGDVGPAVLAGHVDWAGRPGVFAGLHLLAVRDLVLVTRADGHVARFSVTKVERIAKSAFPTGAVYDDLDHPGLRLITCGGTFDHAAHSYEQNVIVFADLLPG